MTKLVAYTEKVELADSHIDVRHFNSTAKLLFLVLLFYPSSTLITPYSQVSEKKCSRFGLLGRLPIPLNGVWFSRCCSFSLLVSFCSAFCWIRWITLIWYDFLVLLAITMGSIKIRAKAQAYSLCGEQQVQRVTRMSTTNVKRQVGKYELGRTIGEGTFAKVKFARNSKTGEPVAIKILDKDKVLKHKMVEQIKREIATMKLIKHPNVVRLFEVMGSKTKIFLVLEFVKGGELFDKIPENLLLDEYGSLKVSDFGLSALSQQVRDDGLLHTTCGTPNYVAPEVLNDHGYDGSTADLWSCGVILFVLLAGYLPFEDDNIMNLYKKISFAEFSCPSWFSLEATRLIERILDPNPKTRITIPDLLEDKWFKKGYKPPTFNENCDTNLDDIDSVFKDSEEHHVTEKKEEQPAALNAFDLISMSKGLKLGNFFDAEQEFKRETRFTSKCTANEIITKIEQAAKPLGFDVQKKNYRMRLENVKAGRKGNLNIATEVFQVAPSLHMVEVRKAKGDTLEFHKFYKNLSTSLKDVVWKSEED
ncbi:hypothetical protein HPP92_011316 [Vanilla planifolia]|uniref:non-specific serine/threonine protein kinase n=1 Tax=Vanilla planifolia TaxID=51239 RepID=A0A835V0M4_VANPL|nr:hypothetical protein HPP92_011316 [Vanilla planifolia]